SVQTRRLQKFLRLRGSDPPKNLESSPSLRPSIRLRPFAKRTGRAEHPRPKMSEKRPSLRVIPSSECIEVRGARQNNLKGFDLDIPLGKLCVISGPSGSGKSSLAFDTIYAEGQR